MDEHYSGSDPEGGCGIIVICVIAVVLMAVVCVMVWIGAQ